MLNLLPESKKDGPLKVLCLGAHADDIEIGCGGTILELVETHPDTHIHWVVLSAKGPRKVEATASAEYFLAGANNTNIIIGDIRDGYFPYLGPEVKDFFEGLKDLGSHDLILTHFRHDLHQDHRTVSGLTWNTWRDHLILEYEIPKYDGDLGSPNLFMPLSTEVCNRKITGILDGFQSQQDRHWFTGETFRSLLRLRGVEAQSETGYAEAFYARKLRLRLSSDK